MRKQGLTDNSGRWFDLDTAKTWAEATQWDGGPGDVSRVTGVDWLHEKLFLTVGGTFVLYSWHDNNPTLDSWAEVESEIGVKWLISNGYQKDVAKIDLQSVENRLEI
jgi:hypothetical protein